MSSTFFGVQLAVELAPDHRLRQQLATLVEESRARVSIPAQRTCWTRAAATLSATAELALYGTWDLIRTTGQDQYEEWASGLEAMAQWPLEDFGGDGRFVLVSMIFLVTGGSNADLTLGDRCDLPENEWQRRSTYARLVTIPPMLNFTNVLGSAFYVAPRPDRGGFSAAVLGGDDFTYLKAIDR